MHVTLYSNQIIAIYFKTFLQPLHHNCTTVISHMMRPTNAEIDSLKINFALRGCEFKENIFYDLTMLETACLLSILEICFVQLIPKRTEPIAG